MKVPEFTGRGGGVCLYLLDLYFLDLYFLDLYFLDLIIPYQVVILTCRALSLTVVI